MTEIERVLQDVTAGNPLGISIEKRMGSWFPRYYVVALLRAERTGRLDIVLPLLAERLQYQRAVADDRFPYVPFLIFYSVIILLLFWFLKALIMPVFYEMHSSFGIATPSISVNVFAWMTAVAKHLVIAIAVIFLLMKSERIREAVLPWTPFVAVDKRMLLVRDLAQSMATFLSFGEDVLTSARWSLEATISPWLKPRLARFVARVENGEDWAEAWRDMRLGAFTYPWLISNAAARQDPLGGFNALAEWLHEDISRNTRFTRRWLMPCVVILLGIFVAAFAVAVYVSVWELPKWIL